LQNLPPNTPLAGPPPLGPGDVRLSKEPMDWDTSCGFPNLSPVV